MERVAQDVETGKQTRKETKIRKGPKGETAVPSERLNFKKP
jgi:hypothetical protein